jgi:threonylcarbamoyladenosine tRNA methylthiotransferase MtaB
MKRRYQREIYTERVNKIREDASCLHWRGCDCWFSGETDEHFLKTYRYLNEMDIPFTCFQVF